jgi:transposase-like protein
MPITPTNAFKGRQYPGEVILLAVRWYLRYPLAYLHVAELLPVNFASAAARLLQQPAANCPTARWT